MGKLAEQKARNGVPGDDKADGAAGIPPEDTAENREMTDDAGQNAAESAPEEAAEPEGEAQEWEAGQESQDGAEGPEEGEEDNGEAAEGKSFFRKKPKVDKKQEALKQKVEELEDRVKRQMAEFDNFRKRTEKEKTAMFETGAKSVVEKILPIVDNFERGLATVPEEEKGSGFADGMQMVYKQLMTELENLGVKPIEAIGQEFNPDFHNAVMQVESEEYESGMIAQELQKGYMYRDSVVRHSMVGVVS
jgi:Molecular chaperone GrpE (heat shock protein)